MTRLIDADELKKKFNERGYWTYTQEYGDAIPIGWIMSGIDNAPTVELDESIIQGVLNKRCMTAVTNEYLVALHGNGRPKGEWTVSGYIDTCRGYVAKCPFCKEDTVGGGNFCKHCGADMRKGGDE